MKSNTIFYATRSWSYRGFALIGLLIILGFSPQATERARAEPGDLANWVVDTHQGKRLSLYQQLERGEKVVVIFWATWCRFCRELLPELDALYTSGDHQNTTFVAMNIWEDGNPIKYMEDKSMKLPVVLRAESLAHKYNIRETPGVIVIGEGQKVLYRRKPGQSPTQVVKRITEALKAH